VNIREPAWEPNNLFSTGVAISAPLAQEIWLSCGIGLNEYGVKSAVFAEQGMISR
jgi:hypothetical protein